MSMLHSVTKGQTVRERNVARPVRVGFYVFFPAGGIGRYTNELLRAMSAIEDLQAEAICTPDFQWKDSEDYSVWAGLKSIHHSIPVLRRLRFLHRQFVNPVRCLRHAKKTGMDIVHFSNINHLSFPFWQQYFQRSNVRVAISVHDVKRQKHMLNREWEDRQLKATYKFADALFVHSSYQVNELVNFAGVSREKVHIVPHGPYSYGAMRSEQREARLKFGLPLDEQIALFFGQVRDEKNLEGFIEAMALADDSFHLVVAGHANAHHHGLAYYQECARRNGVEDRITFLYRFIPDEEVSELYAASDWVALPYLNTFTSQSGVLNIAAYYERPVFVSSSPVLQETVRNCDIGYVCESDQSVDLAKGIHAMVSRIHDGHKHQFEEYRDLYSWAENARITLGVYQNLLNV